MASKIVVSVNVYILYKIVIIDISTGLEIMYTFSKIRPLIILKISLLYADK